jgi:L-ascorbate metabolism protein UlaG (beta-lactamase superfamily)
MRPEDLPLPAGAGDVRVQWLGTAGFLVEHAGFVLVFDPYLTRASLAACALTRLSPDAGLLARTLPRVDAIVLGHTHFDHALDAPLLARTTGARVLGSRSALALCRGQGVPEAQLELVEGAATRETDVGPFRLRFWPSAHAPVALGRVPFPGEIADCDDVPLRMGDYRCGAIFGVEIEVAGRRLYHVGSAELLEHRVGEVDLVLACVAGWKTTVRYPERLVAALSPGRILLHHWDNFFRPLAGGARPLPGLALPRFVDRLRAAAPGVELGTLPLLGETRL